jgi:hypothetical protein
MIDEKLITDLAEKEFVARETLQGYYLMNSSNSVQYEQRKQNAINYALAIARQREAKFMLDEAIEGRMARKAKDAV